MNRNNIKTSIFLLVAILSILIMPRTSFGQIPVGNTYISTNNSKGYFALAVKGKVAPIYIADTDYPGVMIAVKSLQADFRKVTTDSALLLKDHIAQAKNAIIIGTLDKNDLIDRLVSEKKLNISDIKGKWEAHITQVVNNPFPGVKQALVIVGSDKRGTIYGIYELSTQIGVSPWYWWADVPVKQQKNLYVIPGIYVDGGPAVKYRGIFINDEAPSFSGWAKEKFGGVNHLLYTKMFELILRLKGNYLWPAMWDNAFNDDDKLDPVLAYEYGVVMGTSHHEPMDRAQQEWKRYGAGAWDYSTNAATLRSFWRKGIEHMGSKETIVTVGMRGDGDKPMTEGSNIALLERIVADQRTIIADVTHKAASETPQMWALYKEVQDYYDKGMRVPDDVTLLLCDDNWGNIRKLPKLGEPARKGGYGIYYHFDYVGDPRNYKWLNTNPISKTWEQMHLAYEYGAKQVWIVNVGDLKPMEFPISFFLDYAWSPDKWPASRLGEYTRQWAAQQFGNTYAHEIADILTAYTKYNGRRKPEQIDQNTYSLINYREFETVVSDYNQLAEKARRLYIAMPKQYKNAFYQLVLHPVEACANLNEMYFDAAKNKLYAMQGRAATNLMCTNVKELFKKDSAISYYYNKIMADGKWDHMMDQTHIGYTYWQEPRTNKMPAIQTIELPSQSKMGVAIEGSESWWPNEQSKAILPGFYPYCSDHYIEVFNRGQGSFNFTITSSSPYIIIKTLKGNVSLQQRIWINVNWEKMPKVIKDAAITINGSDGDRVVIHAIIHNEPPDNKTCFNESNGYVSIEAEHYNKAINSHDIKWETIPNYGRTLSGVMPSPVTAKSQIPINNNPHLEYKVNIIDTGWINVAAFISPTLDFTNANGLQFAVSIDDEKPQIMNINTDESNKSWGKNVSDNIKIIESKHHITKSGVHVLKYWMVSPGVVLQKIVIDSGNLAPSYFGPPESLRY
jgi:hypothetical protein